jgi:ketosteroid isomerase-like protein
MFAILLALAATGSEGGQSAEGELLEAERRFTDAVLRGDVEALKRITGEEWVIIGADGKVMPREAFLGVIASGALLHTTMTFDEPRVRAYGDTGIVTTRTTTAGTYQGEPFSAKERSTDVFVRDRGQWKCVLTHLTTIAEK